MPTSTPSTPYTEPWLRGTHADVHAAGRAVLHALELALDDLTKWTAGLTDDEVHAQPLGLTPIAFHLRHIAGATDRILTYAEGEQLSPEQLLGGPLMSAVTATKSWPDWLGQGFSSLL